LKIKVLGTRGEVKPLLPYHSKHSGVLVDNFILLDLGEKEYLDYRPTYIFITHLHPDHAFFVVQKAPEITIPVYAPEDYRDTVRVTVISNEVRANSYRVIPIPTHHSKKVKSTAYLVTNGKHRLLYTGDLIWINKEYHHLLGDLDLVITDGSYFRRGGMVRKDRDTGQLYGHNGVPDLINLFKKFTRHILFVHFGSWFYEGVEQSRLRLSETGKQNGIIVDASYDGMELDIDDLSNN
jgi:glyoxylase-like metal-dependent hydrolase (beta-lactamase superfamily II)